MTLRALILIAAAALPINPARAQPPAAREFDGEVARIGADIDGYNRFYSLRWSEDLLEKQQQFLREKLASLNNEPFDTFSQSGKVDYLLLRNDISSALDRNRLTRRQLAEMDSVLAARAVIVPLEQARWRMEKLDPQAAASLLATLPDMLKTVRERVEKGRNAKKEDAETPEEPASIMLSAAAGLRASRAVSELNGSLRRWFEYYDGYEPAFNWWCAKPYEEANKALDDLAKYLREEVAGVKGKPEDPLVGDPIGREALLDDLRAECIALSPEELIALGETEFAWCEDQMKSAAREMGLGEDWKAALARVKSLAVPPGEQTDYVTGVAREAVAFMKEKDLLTVPPLCEETWRINMLSPQAQRTLPFAVYSGQAIGVAYASAEMSHEDKLMSMRGNNRHFTRIVVPHELIPGHHLQSFMSQRERPYRRRFNTPFYVEGWALYWEMKLWDMGWAKSPEDRVGMLFWRMHRCARIVVSLKFHLGEMTPQEMVDYLVDRVGHERFGATSEVRRYIAGDYSPLYQCGYMIGGKQLRALWKEAVAPGRLNEKQFNDAVLKAGPIPIELLRAEMVNVPLTRESRASWKFGN